MTSFNRERNSAQEPHHTSCDTSSAARHFTGSVAEKNPATDSSDESPSLLKDLSLAQVIASSLAAVTAFALSSRIGIAGSVIGVAVGAAASGIASQIYQNILKKSAYTLRGLTNSDNDGSNGSNDGDGGSSNSPARRVYAAASENHGRMAPDSLCQQAAHNHKVRIARRAAIVSALFAIVAVLLYALLVNVFTQGTGIGPQIHVSSIVSSSGSDAGEQSGTSTDDSNKNDTQDTTADKESSDTSDSETSKSTSNKDSNNTDTSSTDSNSTDSKKDSGSSSDSESTSDTSKTSPSNQGTAGSDSTNSGDATANSGSSTSKTSN